MCDDFMKKKHRFYWEEDRPSINIEVPEFSKDEISVSIENNFVNIVAAKKGHSVKKGKDFYKEEAFSQSIQRTIPLPENFNVQDAEIIINDGKVVIKRKKKKVVE